MLDASAKEFNDFLRSNSMYIAVGIAIFILLILLVIFLVTVSKRKKKGATPKRVIVASAYIEALGGEENIVSHNLVRSRIVLTLKDYALVDKEKLKEAGVDGFIMMSDKLTLVIKGDAEKVNAAIFPER